MLFSAKKNAAFPSSLTDQSGVFFSGAFSFKYALRLSCKVKQNSPFNID